MTETTTETMTKIRVEGSVIRRGLTDVLFVAQGDHSIDLFDMEFGLTIWEIISGG
jgi:hypothetical protein